MSDKHSIVFVRGHYEVRDEGGNFVLSGDTWEECYSDLQEIISED